MDTNDIRAQTQAAGLSWASVRRGKSWLKIKAERF
jgi:hypothetical protein